MLDTPTNAACILSPLKICPQFENSNKAVVSYMNRSRFFQVSDFFKFISSSSTVFRRPRLHVMNENVYIWNKTVDFPALFHVHYKNESKITSFVIMCL